MTLFIGVYYSNTWHSTLLQYPVQYLQRRMAQLFLLTRDHICFPCRLLVTDFSSVTCGSFWFSTKNLCQLILVSPDHTTKYGNDSFSSYMHRNHLQHLSCQSVSSFLMACNSLSECGFQSLLCRKQWAMVLQTLVSEQCSRDFVGNCLKIVKSFHALSPSAGLFDVAWCPLCNL
jgi:hypothetical protein